MNDNVYRHQRNSAIPSVIFALLIANGLVFVLQQLNQEFMYINFALCLATDPRPPFALWQILTYGFLHGNVTHIEFNMFVLWMFGRESEWPMGSQRFLLYVLVCVFGAAVL